MRVLFIHQNFPGQFRHLAGALLKGGHDVRSLCVQGKGLPGISTVRHGVGVEPPAGGHPWVSEFSRKTSTGTSALQALASLHTQDWKPDLVVAHPAWGEAMFVKDLWPSTPLLCYLEFFYRWQGQDVGFDPEFSQDSLEQRAKLRLKNLTHLLALEAMDMGLTPTQWQQSTFPSRWRSSMRVIFDGIDTDHVRPAPQTRLTLQDAQGNQRTIKAGDEVLTFVARNLEPYRGYHQFMRALPAIQQKRPQAVTLIVGGNGTSYGARPPNGQSWKDVYLREVGSRLDLRRVFFLGPLAYERYLKVLQVSACHLYLTYPFVLSWSCMEALSAGCMVVGSRTAPVQEVIEEGRNGLLCDFFDHEDICEKVSHVLATPERYRTMRERARTMMVENYDLKRVSLPRQLALVQELTGLARA